MNNIAQNEYSDGNIPLEIPEGMRAAILQSLSDSFESRKLFKTGEFRDVSSEELNERARSRSTFDLHADENGQTREYRYRMGIANVKHIRISEAPSIVVTSFLERQLEVNSPDFVTESMHFVVSTEGVPLETLLSQYDSAVPKDALYFILRLNSPMQHTHQVVHRYIPPQLRRGGLGAMFFSQYESLFQNLAYESGESQTSLIDTCKYDTMCFALKNGYDFASEQERATYERVVASIEAGSSDFWICDDNTMMEWIDTPHGKIRIKVYISLAKKFNSSGRN